MYFHGTVPSGIGATDEEHEILQGMLNLAPTFETVLLEFVEEPGFLGQFISKRKDDTGSISYTAPGYIPFNTEEHFLDSPITKVGAKSSRGFNQQATACLLCPIKRLNEFDVNPMLFMTKVNDGLISIKASSWPSFIYDKVEFDGEWVGKGLCWGYFLLRVCIIFSRPSSAITGESKGSRALKGQLHGLMEVTRHTIVYAAVQLLYPIEQWKCYDGNFDQEAFFKNIVKLFETNPGHCGVKETLVWWNQQVLRLTCCLGKQKRAEKSEQHSSSNETLICVLLIKGESEL